MLRLLKAGLSKWKSALSKTGSSLGNKIRTIFSRPLDLETIDLLEQTLFEADLGSDLALEATAHMTTFAKAHPQATTESLLEEMKRFALHLFDAPSKIEEKPLQEGKPHMILIVGVNGSGKTTTSAKLAYHYKQQKKDVLLAAGDTFRSAAIEQLTGWAEKLDIPCVKGSYGGDSASIIFDALTAANKRSFDVLIADTAGRLQAKTDLMEELGKISRVCSKVLPGAPQDTFLVLDATMGKNGIDQAKIFHSFTPLTGLILTKIDGSAKGGIALAIYREMGIPIRYVGVGEKASDLLPFDKKSYVDALFS